jgi:hypothetical protein
MISRRRAVGAILVGGVALSVVSGCALIESRKTMRYRLIVEVETPQGIKSGSSVIEVTALKTPISLPGAGGLTNLGGLSCKGEAAAVDLPNGQALFALLQTEGGFRRACAYPLLAFKHRLNAFAGGYAQIQLISSWKGQRSPMPQVHSILPKDGGEISGYPMLVTFKDITDPTSVERINPDDLAASFGKGYKLKSISVTITDEPVTTGIESKLPSYGPETGFNEWYKGLPYGDPKAISKSDFIQD